MITKLRITRLAVLAMFAATTLSDTLAEDNKKKRPTFTDRALRDGERVPDFNALDQTGKLWESKTMLPMNCTIVWFYKGDFLLGSIKQAKLLRDKVPQLHKHGVEVIGISGDEVKNHCPFSRTYKLEFTLLEDPYGELAELFGVTFTKGGKARLRDAEGRVVIDPVKMKSTILSRGVTVSPCIFVIGRNGKIIYRQPICEAEDDIDAVVEFLRDRNWR